LPFTLGSVESTSVANSIPISGSANSASKQVHTPSHYHIEKHSICPMTDLLLQVSKQILTASTAQVCYDNKTQIPTACNHLPFSMLFSVREETTSVSTAQVCCNNKTGIRTACNHLPFSMVHSRREETTPVRAQCKFAVTTRLESQLLATISHFPCWAADRKRQHQ
jgi:hypothetical protein